jgi:hypothetical protein
MNINENQFDAIAYIFEKDNGNSLGDYENNIIDESGLKGMSCKTLVDAILDNLKENHSIDTAYRLSAYWALSKRFDKALLPYFKVWLKDELLIKGAPAVFQILIALDNIEESVFGKDRNGSFSGDDMKLNIRDAEIYLENMEYKGV